MACRFAHPGVGILGKFVEIIRADCDICAGAVRNADEVAFLNSSLPEFNLAVGIVIVPDFCDKTILEGWIADSSNTCRPAYIGLFVPIISVAFLTRISLVAVIDADLVGSIPIGPLIDPILYSRTINLIDIISVRCAGNAGLARPPSSS